MVFSTCKQSEGNRSNAVLSELNKALRSKTITIAGETEINAPFSVSAPAVLLYGDSVCVFVTLTKQ